MDVHLRGSVTLSIAAVTMLVGCVSQSAPTFSTASSNASPRSLVACETLAGKTFGDVHLLDAATVPIGTELTSQFGGNAMIDKPMCRVQGQIRPTSDSNIRFEVWLPSDGNWNRYYQAIGGGGNAGTFSRKAMKRAFDGGYAVSGQDNGHVGNSGDSSYAIGHPEKVIDFGWRSLHAVAVASKSVIAAYYGQAQDLSLFNGCSTGGRQALALAQRFPADYDGISAGAPANYWPALNAISAKFGRFLMEHPNAWVSPEKLAMVETAVHKQCGAVEGIIDDPGACRFDVAKLECTGKDGPDCLTKGEVAGLEARFADLTEDDGTLIYPSFTPGYETSIGRFWFGKSQDERWYSSISARMPEGFFRDYVHGRSNWTIREFDWKKDLAAAKAGVIGKAVAAEETDLSAFASRGGKLIQWHGWHDMAIPARNSVRYYSDVVDRMGVQKVATFYRLFMGTGVDHCANGPGPDSIGGSTTALYPADADHDVMAALIRWIKTNRAPEQIIATKFDPSGSVVAQRPWCAYPGVAHWDGKGDRTKAESYSCPTR